MIDERYIDLINKRIDGSITDTEDAELQAYLAGRGEAQKLYDEMIRLPNLIRQLDKFDPPRELKRKILGSIDLMKYKPLRRPSWLTGIPSIFRSKASLRYVYSFSVGILVGIVVYAASVNNLGGLRNLDPSDLSGTIVTGGETKDFRVTDFDRFALDGLAGSIETAVGGDVVLVRLSITSDGEIELAFEYEPSVFNFHGYRHRVDQSISLDITPGCLRMKHQGENEYMFVFKNGSQLGTTMAFKVYSGRLLYDCRINTAVGNG